MTLLRSRQHRPDREDRSAFRAMRMHMGLEPLQLVQRVRREDPELSFYAPQVHALETTGFVSEERALRILKAGLGYNDFDALRSAVRELGIDRATLSR